MGIECLSLPIANPDDLSYILNYYLNRMADIATGHGGYETNACPCSSIKSYKLEIPNLSQVSFPRGFDTVMAK